MDKLVDGYCGICGTQIFEVQNGKNRPNLQYIEISLFLSNDTIAKTGICKTCYKTATDKDTQSLFGLIKGSWLDSMVGWASDKQFEKVRLITLDSWDRSPDRIIQKALIVKLAEFVNKLQIAKTAYDLSLQVIKK
jgi:hypothetical protein